MLIVCPQCGFSRNVSENRLNGRYVTVTCPKCQCKFRLFSNGVMDILEDRHNAGDSEEDRRIVASRAYEREKRRWEEEKPEEPPKTSGVAWERAPNGVSWPDAFFRTVLGVMFSAQKFFPALNRNASLLRPLAFYMLICVFQIIVERIWMETLLEFFNSTALDDPQVKELLEKFAPQSGFFLFLLLRAGIYAFQLYIFSFLMELAFRLAAPGKSTFPLVFQIVAYSCAPYLLCVVPGLGNIAALVWSIGCIAIGCKTAMLLSWPQVFAGFLPALCLILPVFYSLAAGLGG